MERVQKWIEIAKWAPSGGNAQPWQVTATASQEKIELKMGISNKYRQDPSPMDTEGAASVMALGSFVQNLRSICLQDGFTVSHVDFDFSESFWKSHVTVSIVPQRGQETDFQRPYTADEILGRRTDRGPFKKTSLPSDFHEELGRILLKYNIIFHQFTSNTSPAKESLFLPFSKIEKARLQNSQLLEGLLKEIGFNQDQEKNKIPVTQLGISKMDQFLLRFFRDHPWSRKIMQTPLVGLPVSNVVHSFIDPCERICFLVVNQGQDSFSDSGRQTSELRQAFELGECFQNIWLEAHRHEISFQPLGLPFILLGFHRGSSELRFSEKNRNDLEEASRAMKKLGIDFSKLAIGFRLGKTIQPAPRTFRLDLRLEDQEA